jgi:hypothetical protein
MCGRTTKDYTWEQIHAMYQLAVPGAIPNMQSSFNVCPTDPMDTVVAHEGNHRHSPRRRSRNRPARALCDSVLRPVVRSEPGGLLAEDWKLHFHQGLTGKLEFLHADLSSSVLFNIVPGVPETVSFRTNIFRAGISYKFWP